MRGVLGSYVWEFVCEGGFVCEGCLVSKCICVCAREKEIERENLRSVGSREI